MGDGKSGRFGARAASFTALLFKGSFVARLDPTEGISGDGGQFFLLIYKLRDWGTFFFLGFGPKEVRDLTGRCGLCGLGCATRPSGVVISSGPIIAVSSASCASVEVAGLVGKALSVIASSASIVFL